jgi:hypothetical protein
MNRIVFPHLERALQHYGLAKTVVIERNSDGNLNITQTRANSWRYLTDDNQSPVFDNAYEYQQYHSMYSKIIHTTSTK